jgi:isochorismate synthase
VTVAPLLHPAPGLLERYTPGEGTLLASPRATLLLRGAAATVPPGPLATLPARAAATLAEAGPGAILSGAIPWDPAAPAHLVVAGAAEVAGPLHLWADDVAPVLAGTPRITPVPPPAAYVAAVTAGVGEIGAGALEKVVLARALDVVADAPIAVGALLRNLAAADPRALVFAVDLPGGGVLAGASPELLVRRHGGEAHALPLAGSAARHPDPVEDGRRAAALLRSAKDRAEHAVVVDAVAAALAPWCDALDVPAGPELVRTSTLWHLATPVRGRLADPATTSLDLAAALHPTPAVCGAPTAAARAAIARLEPFERGWYAGAVGWQDADGNGEWAVTIRCAEIRGSALRLWAGAGIVAASDPAAELAETEAKCRTLLAAMGLAA